jgi:hypothetical protein
MTNHEENAHLRIDCLLRKSLETGPFALMNGPVDGA